MISLVAAVLLQLCAHDATSGRPLGERSLRVTSVTRFAPIDGPALWADEPKSPPSSAPPAPPAPAPPLSPQTPPSPAPKDPPAAIPAGATKNAPKSGLHELFPGVYADLEAKIVEFDGVISPMLVKDEKAPSFFLESIVCSPDTREHESFVVSKVKPSHIHAALLATGLKPGSPGSWTFKDNKLTPVDPSGDRVTMMFVAADKDGRQTEHDPLDWIVREKDQKLFRDLEKTVPVKNAPDEKDVPPPPSPGWLFAGSKLRKRTDEKGETKEVYDADGSGTIVGLTSFGSEVITWSRMISPDASVQAPEWVADFSKTLPANTKVRVRIKKAT